MKPDRRPIHEYVARVLGASAASLTLATAAAANQSATATPAPASTSATTQGEEQLAEVVITTQRFNYNVIESANKIPLSVKDTPQSVRIVTGDMLNFSSVTRINDLYKLDAGAHASNSYDIFVFTSSRGFVTEGNAINAFKVDGFRAYDYFQFDFATYERMEIVKGATSTLYGQAGLTGTVNLISKKPQKEFGGYTTLELGDYDYYRAEMDIYGALTENEKLTGRMVFAYLDRDSSLVGNFKRQLTLAPSLKYEFSPQTSALLQVNYQTAEFAPSPGLGIQFLGGDESDGSNYVAPQVPRSRYAYYPWSQSDKDALVVTGVVQHHFANDWQMRVGLNYSKFKTFTSSGHIFTTAPDPDRAGENLSIAYTYIEDSTNASFGGEVNLFGNVELFGREHTLFFGADYARVDRDFPGYAITNVSDGTTFSILDPDYTLFAEAHSLRDYLAGGVYQPRGFVGLYQLGSHMNLGGLTAQVLLKPTDRLSFLLGARYSQSESFRSEQYEEGDPADFPADYFDIPLGPQRKVDALTTSEMTYQAGATYKFTDDITAYLSYGEVFNPREEFAFDPNDVNGEDGVGTPIGPEEGTAYEAGVKGELRGGKAFWSLGVFQISRDNVTQNDIDHPNFSIALGKQRSRGVELDFQGEIRPGWSVYVSSAKMDNEYTEGEFAGRKASTGPKFGLNVYSSYEIREGALAGLGFGGGVIYKDRQRFDWGLFEVTHAQGRLLPSVIPSLGTSTTEVDLRAFYNRDKWRYEIEITNAFNEEYYAPFFDDPYGWAWVNPGREIKASVTRRF